MNHRLSPKNMKPTIDFAGDVEEFLPKNKIMKNVSQVNSLHFTGTAHTQKEPLFDSSMPAHEQTSNHNNRFYEYFGSMTIHTVLKSQKILCHFYVCGLQFFLYHICGCWIHRLKTQLHFIRNHNNNRNGLLWFFDVSSFAIICNDCVIHGHEPF